jgi:adenosine deaminase/adenosine deaminase CECR1
VADAMDFNTNFVTKLHTDLKLTMNVSRCVIKILYCVLWSLILFKNLVVAFISADSSPLMAGVNIVSPEDGETSMKDHWLHMVMFNYCHTKFPDVKY